MAHQKGYNSSPYTSTFMHAIKQGPDITKRGDICYHPRHILKDKILFSNIACDKFNSFNLSRSIPTLRNENIEKKTFNDVI